MLQPGISGMASRSVLLRAAAPLPTCLTKDFISLSSP
ncbi:hypothetical protein AK812_SmicGene47965, partial [Symbiodinium microadriaticum]